jgi:hypothetical protein
MSRNPRPTNVAKRTTRPGKRTTLPVESSVKANHRPRQPKIRQTPPRSAPPSKAKSKRGEDPNTIEGKTKKAVSLRESRERISAEVVEHAAATGMLPHEWLLAVMRGEQINHFAYDADTQEIIEVIVLPTFSDRMEAAKSAAPYFATKLNPKEGGKAADPSKQPGVMEVPLADSMQRWTEMAQTSQSLLKREVTK